MQEVVRARPGAALARRRRLNRADIVVQSDGDRTVEVALSG